MFERYTEPARRSIFFARTEASGRGSPFIETEHLLLGLLRADEGALQTLLPSGMSADTIAGELPPLAPAEMSGLTDQPLSHETKRALTYAAEEAERMGHRHIGCEHLLLGLMREETFLAARLLKTHGISREQLWKDVAATEMPDRSAAPVTRDDLHALVESLPDGAIAAAGRTLQHLQVWPPRQPAVPPRIAELQQQMRDRMMPGARSGTRGVGGVGGMWSAGEGGEVKSGHFLSSRMEDGAAVFETHWFHEGHEITIIERLRLSDDGRTLGYSQQITGPNQERQYQIDFNLP